MPSPYSDVVMDHFHAPRNVGRMQDPDAVGTAGTPGRGPFMVLYLKIVNRRISAARFQTYGCAPAIAAGSLLTERLVGLSLPEALAWTEPALVHELGGLPAHKRHCSELAVLALRAALGGGTER